MSTFTDINVSLAPASAHQINADNENKKSSAAAESLTAAATDAARWDVVRRAISAVALPASSIQLRRYHAVTSALARGNGFAAIGQLNQHNPTHVHPSLYAAAVLACEALAEANMDIDGKTELFCLMRHQIRVELMELPLSANPLWVVPGNFVDRTAAHVGALILAATGQPSRPWLWAGSPQHEDFLLLGRRLKDHPVAASRHCAYTFDLQAIVRHFLHV